MYRITAMVADQEHLIAPLGCGGMGMGSVTSIQIKDLEELCQVNWCLFWQWMGEAVEVG